MKKAYITMVNKIAIRLILIAIFISIITAISASLFGEIEFGMAERFLDDHKLIESETEFENAIMIDAFNSRYPAGLGSFLLKQSINSDDKVPLLKKAEPLFIKAHELNPKNAEYALGLGQVRIGLFLEGRTEEDMLRSALADFRKAFDNDPNGFSISYDIGYTGLSVWRFLSEEEREFILERLGHSLKIKPYYARQVYTKLWKETKDFGLLQKITPGTLYSHERLYDFLITNGLLQFRKAEKEKLDFYRPVEGKSDYRTKQLQRKQAIEKIKKESTSFSAPFVANKAWKTFMPSDGKFHKEGNIYGNGSVYYVVFVPRGSTALKISARGSPAGGVYPYMIVELDGEEVGAVFVNSPDWNEYEFKIKSIDGLRVLTITFINDKTDKKKGEDRNLYIGEARVE